MFEHTSNVVDTWLDLTLKTVNGR